MYISAIADGCIRYPVVESTQEMEVTHQCILGTCVVNEKLWSKASLLDRSRYTTLTNQNDNQSG